MRRYLIIFFGNLLMAAAYAFITVPQNIVNGGLTSLSMSLARLAPYSVAELVSALTLLLLLLCYIFLGAEYFRGSLFSCCGYLLLFNFFSTLEWVPQLTAAEAVTISGAALGIGYYCCIISQATAVGIDTIALMLHAKRPNWQLAPTMYAINAAVLLFGYYILGAEAVIKGLLFTGVQTVTLHFLLKCRQIPL